MKQETIEKLEAFRDRLRNLKREVAKVPGKTINRVALRTESDAIATFWVEELRSPLEHKFELPGTTIQDMAESMKQLHVLSRPSNLKSSYTKTINSALSKFDDKFILPIKQAAVEVESLLDLQKLVPGLPDPEESDYLREAVDCANSGFRRAAVVMGWCAAIDKVQKKILAIGLDQFNKTSIQIKSKTKGKYKNWNKEFSISTLAELQAVFDTDLIVVLEVMGLLDGNQADRLRTCFQYRNQSAHPGLAPIEDPHLVAFFTDINAMIFQNPKFSAS